tara:strand:- start:49 stop:294 length:246 start_codon:yes stop_codon:yes gene_type:complete
MGGAFKPAVKLAQSVGVVAKKSKPTPTSPAPTAPMVSQSQAADAYDARRTKARGRSTTIMTGPRGVEEETLTLSKKSLLGK